MTSLSTQFLHVPIQMAQIMAFITVLINLAPVRAITFARKHNIFQSLLHLCNTPVQYHFSRVFL